jgi:hypothetical protein
MGVIVTQGKGIVSKSVDKVSKKKEGAIYAYILKSLKRKNFYAYNNEVCFFMHDMVKSFNDK